MMPTSWSLQTREAVRRRPDFGLFLSILEAADDAADELEDAVFLLDLDTLQGKALDALQTLADLLAEASQEWIKALGHATQIGRAAGRAESRGFPDRDRPRLGAGASAPTTPNGR